MDSTAGISIIFEDLLTLYLLKRNSFFGIVILYVLVSKKDRRKRLKIRRWAKTFHRCDKNLLVKQ